MSKSHILPEKNYIKMTPQFTTGAVRAAREIYHTDPDENEIAAIIDRETCKEVLDMKARLEASERCREDLREVIKKREVIHSGQVAELVAALREQVLNEVEDRALAPERTQGGRNMNGPYHVNDKTPQVLRVLDADGEETCTVFPSISGPGAAQRIADALNAQDRADFDAAKAVGTKFVEEHFAAKRDPDRVRLAGLNAVAYANSEGLNCDATDDDIARAAVGLADATLAQLDATAKKGTT